MRNGTQQIGDGTTTVTLQYAGATCRLCGGRGRDPYSHQQSCRSCNGRGWKASRHGVTAIVAIDDWRKNPPVAEGDDVLAAFVTFAQSLAGVTVTITTEA